MAEHKAKTGWLRKIRERRRLRTERIGDTPEAEAERRRQQAEFDELDSKKRIGGGSLFS